MSAGERADNGELMLTILRHNDQGDAPARDLSKQFADSITVACNVDGSGSLGIPMIANGEYQAAYTIYGP